MQYDAPWCVLKKQLFGVLRLSHFTSHAYKACRRALGSQSSAVQFSAFSVTRMMMNFCSVSLRATPAPVMGVRLSMILSCMNDSWYPNKPLYFKKPNYHQKANYTKEPNYPRKAHYPKQPHHTEKPNCPDKANYHKNKTAQIKQSGPRKQAALCLYARTLYTYNSMTLVLAKTTECLFAMLYIKLFIRTQKGQLSFLGPVYL